MTISKSEQIKECTMYLAYLLVMGYMSYTAYVCIHIDRHQDSDIGDQKKDRKIIKIQIFATRKGIEK